MIEIRIRPASPEDAPFIISSFLRSRRNEGDAKHMVNDVYYAREKARAEAIARGPVIVAHLDEDPWLILGWLAYEPRAIVYAYTRFTFRRIGVFDALYRHVGAPPDCRIVGHAFADLRDRYGFTFKPGAST